MQNSYESELRSRKFDGKRTAKLGTEANPATVSVKTEKRKKEVSAIFKENDWRFNVNQEPDMPEDISDLELLLNPIQPVKAEKKTGRNEPCPCGSGKKFKKCCG